MQEIVVVMVTLDRFPQENYLAETLQNLKRAGVWESENLHSFHMFDSGSFSKWPDTVIDADMIHNKKIHIHRANLFRVANLNVAEALNFGASLNRKWVLFLEDDIDVCDKFIESVTLWLNENGLREDRHIFAFGANYDSIDSAYALKKTTWDYGINLFYGTQAIAFRSRDAHNLSCYLKENVFSQNAEGTAYDLVMASWAKDVWPEIKYFLASVPSFVQHIGRESIINPRPKTHMFPSFPGHNWKYEGQKERV
jgi:hypothetical protein